MFGSRRGAALPLEFPELLRGDAATVEAARRVAEAGGLRAVIARVASHAGSLRDSPELADQMQAACHQTMAVTAERERSVRTVFAAWGAGDRWQPGFGTRHLHDDALRARRDGRLSEHWLADRAVHWHDRWLASRLASWWSDDGWRELLDENELAALVPRGLHEVIARHGWADFVRLDWRPLITAARTEGPVGFGRERAAEMALAQLRRSLPRQLDRYR